MHDCFNFCVFWHVINYFFENNLQICKVGKEHAEKHEAEAIAKVAQLEEDKKKLEEELARVRRKLEEELARV